MSTLQRHQHIYTTLEGHMVSSTIIPMDDQQIEAITTTSLSILTGVHIDGITKYLAQKAVKTYERNGQEWVSIFWVDRLFTLDTPP